MNITKLIQEHDAQNAIYQNAKTALSVQADPSNSGWIALADERLDSLLNSLSEISEESLVAATSYVENVDALVSLFDDVVLECALLVKKRDTVEEKILNHVKAAISQPTSGEKRNHIDEHVVASFIDGLVMSEIPLVLRSTSMVAALLDDTNPLRLGLVYYRMFCNKYPDFADKPALEYLNNEEEARFFLLSGQNSKAVECIAKLFDSPVKSPEKFILMALNSFYSGFESDAVRSLEIGLETFPANIRLSNAKDGLLGIEGVSTVA